MYILSISSITHTKESAILYAIFAVHDIGMKVYVKIEYPDRQQIAYECAE